MALAASITMLRRAAYSSLLPRRSLLAARSAAAADVDRSLVVPLSRFSTSSAAAAVPSQIAKKDLVRLLDAECEILERETGASLKCPFRIKYTESEHAAILSRRYEDEIIRAEVDMKEDEGDEKHCMRVVVTISKESGNSELVFKIRGFDDRIAIDSLFVKKDLWDCFDGQLPTHFGKLDEKLKEGFHNYLEMRGINLTTTNFLREHIGHQVYKEETRMLNWLYNLKKFLA